MTPAPGFPTHRLLRHERRVRVVIVGAGFAGLETAKALRRAAADLAGDTAAVFDAKGAPIPNMAPAAKQMGHYVGALIAGRIAGRPAPKPFRYMDVREIATIGRRAAVYNYGRLRLKGFIGWMFWSAIHIYFLIGLRNRFVVAVTWLWSYLTFQRGARLITHPERAAPTTAKAP